MQKLKRLVVNRLVRCPCLTLLRSDVMKRHHRRSCLDRWHPILTRWQSRTRRVRRRRSILPQPLHLHLCMPDLLQRRSVLSPGIRRWHKPVTYRCRRFRCLAKINLGLSDHRRAYRRDCRGHAWATSPRRDRLRPWWHKRMSELRNHRSLHARPLHR